MTLQMIYQSAEGLIELSSKFDELTKEREKLISQIKDYEAKIDKRLIKETKLKLEELDENIEKIKYYILKLTTNIQKLADQEKQQ